MMKKLVALLLSLVLVCTAASALAAVSIPKKGADVKVDVKSVMDAMDFPTFGEITEEDGVYSFTLSDDFDGWLTACFTPEDEPDELWGWGVDYDSELDRYYFTLPEGASFEYVELGKTLFEYDSEAGVDITQYATFCSDGSYSGEYHDYVDSVHYGATYDENGKLTCYFTAGEEDEDYGRFWFDSNGNLERYTVYVDENYSIHYSVDGSVLDAGCNLKVEDEYGYYYVWYGWDAEKESWYEDAWDENDNYYKKYVELEGVKDPRSYKAPYINPAKNATWYSNNTVGVLGLSLRDDLGMTDKWYNVVPVDLTVEGTQTIPMVASNIYYFGSAKVTVADGNVTVSYTMPNGHAYLKDECLQWFTSLDEITADFLASPVGEYTFGEPVSISEQLNGQNIALLFICNHVTYRQPITNTGALTRYYNTQERWQNWRAALTELLDNMKTVEAEAATDTDVADAAATETDTAEAAEVEAAEVEAAEAEAAEVEAAEVEAAEEAEAAEAEAKTE